MSLHVKEKEWYDLNILCQFQHQPTHPPDSFFLDDAALIAQSNYSPRLH